MSSDRMTVLAARTVTLRTLPDPLEAASNDYIASDFLLTVREAQERLNVSRTTIYKLAKAGRLRLIHIMGATRVRSSDVATLIQGDVR